MNKEFVSYEQALALKKLGFDEPCLASYETAFGLGFQLGYIIDGPKNYVLAPLKQQAFGWFRENYQASPTIHCMSEQGNSWRYHIPNEGGERDFLTYEEAELACLNKLIELWEIKNKQQ